jgi:hypothetical protein
MHNKNVCLYYQHIYNTCNITIVNPLTNPVTFNLDRNMFTVEYITLENAWHFRRQVESLVCSDKANTFHYVRKHVQFPGLL